MSFLNTLFSIINREIFYPKYRLLFAIHNPHIVTNTHIITALLQGYQYSILWFVYRGNLYTK